MHRTRRNNLYFYLNLFSFVFRIQMVTSLIFTLLHISMILLLISSYSVGDDELEML